MLVQGKDKLLTFLTTSTATANPQSSIEKCVSIIPRLKLDVDSELVLIGGDCIGLGWIG